MAVSNPAMVVYRDGSVLQKIIKKTKELNTNFKYEYRKAACMSPYIFVILYLF